MTKTNISTYISVISDIKISQVLYILLEKSYILGKNLKVVSTNNTPLLISKLKKFKIIEENKYLLNKYIERHNISNYHANKMFFFVLSEDFKKILKENKLLIKIINSMIDEQFKSEIQKEKEEEEKIILLEKRKETIKYNIYKEKQRNNQKLNNYELLFITDYEKNLKS